MEKSTPFKIELFEKPNEKCLKCSNSESRENYIVNDLCKKALSSTDGLPVRCVGHWGYQKIYHLVQYFGIFSQGMYKKWNSLNYIEICSGPGRCVMRNSGIEVNGTALAILSHPYFQQYVSKAIFIDYNKETVDVLNQRIEANNLKDKAEASCVDFNDTQELISVLSVLDKKSLNLVLVDPTQCDVPFSCIETILNELRNVDIIMNIALGTDLRRNIRNAVLDKSFFKVRDKYSRFLGDDNFFLLDDIKNAAREKRLKDLIKIFMERYKQNWQKIGYKYFAEKSVEHYYKIMFASKDKKGLDFWEKANKYEPDGQMTFEGM